MRFIIKGSHGNGRFGKCIMSVLTDYKLTRLRINETTPCPTPKKPVPLRDSVKMPNGCKRSLTVRAGGGSEACFSLYTSQTTSSIKFLPEGGKEFLD